jgi:hypothetical protein
VTDLQEQFFIEVQISVVAQGVDRGSIWMTNFPAAEVSDLGYSVVRSES